MRKNGRLNHEIRPVKITPHYINNPQGSALIEMGETKVLCTVNVESGVPHWLKGASSDQQQGWLTAEYSMLPGSTHTRSRRERNSVGGRTSEIQRLIGRALRGVIDLKKCKDMTFYIDCDVLQADAGTRTASITGSYVALCLAVKALMAKGKLKSNPIIDSVAALSVGLKGKEPLMDLDYSEDSAIDVDMNIVMTGSGKLLEIQGTAEQSSFSKEELFTVLSLVEERIKEMFDLQKEAIGEFPLS